MLATALVRVGAWRMLVETGATIEDVARATGRASQEVADAVTGVTHAHLPGPVVGGRPVDPRLHRGRLLLRTLLDASNRSAGGPGGCWPAIGWTQQGRPARRSSLLGTTSTARAVLVLSSADPVSDDLVAAHICGNGARSAGQEGCIAPHHLIAVDRDTNAGHRRSHRLGLRVVGRAETDLRNLDVLDGALLPELRQLAQLEKELARSTFTDRGCLLKSGTSPDWYGHVTSEGRSRKRHRWVLELAGVDLDGRIVEHSCLRSKGCFSIGHLQASTPSANARHAAEDGLSATGQDHPRARYRNAEVVAMRHDAHLGLTELQRRYGGSLNTLRRALSGATYKHVGGPLVVFPAKRRLSPAGVRLVRILRACGGFETVLADRFDLSLPYMRKLVAGEVRGDAGGPLTAPPGPATGRDVNTGRLGAVDRRLITERLAAGQSCRAIARDLQLHPSSIDRSGQPCTTLYGQGWSPETQGLRAP